MTDNEKRAHDLAVAAAAKAVSAENKDIYVLYKQSYEAALNAFNRDFPEK